MARKSVASTQVALAAADLIEREAHQMMEAYKLRQAGKGWFQIAAELELPAAKVRSLYSQAITEAAQLVADATKSQILAMELDRLDALQAAHWARATEPRVQGSIELPPDLKSAEFCLKVIAARTKLEGLEHEDVSNVGPQTVVIAGTSAEYIQALQMVAGVVPEPIQAEAEWA